jgi:hypothetical protein
MTKATKTAAKKAPAAKIAGKVQGSPSLNKEPSSRPSAAPTQARPSAVIGNAPFRVKTMGLGGSGDYYLKGTVWTSHRADANTFDDAVAAQAALDKARKFNPKAAKLASIIGQSVPLPAPQAPAEAAPATQATAKPEAAHAPAKGAGKGSRQPGGKKAEVLAAAQAGKLPATPDFSSPTHKPYRARLAVLVDLATNGDLKGLRAVEMIPPRSTSPKAMHRYRDLCMIALEAQTKAGKPVAQWARSSPS